MDFTTNKEKIEEKLLKAKATDNVDLNALYEHGHSELSLQQSKRDQIITLYIALFSLIIPFAFSVEKMSYLGKGMIFLSIGIIGVLFSLIIIRYRIYKEAYWLGCQTLTLLMGYDKSVLCKEVVQEKYKECFMKKGKTYIKQKNGEKRFNYRKFIKNNLFSAETLHYVILSFITSIISGLAIGISFYYFKAVTLVSVLIGTGYGIILFILLLRSYFKQLILAYKFVVCENDNSFNMLFGKTWFLHFYSE